LHEQKKIKGKKEHNILTRFRNLPTSETDLIKSIKYKIQSLGDNTPLYITTGPMKIRKPKL